MSFRKENKMVLAGVDFASVTDDELNALFKRYLENGMHGLCYSIYEDGQKPGSIITRQQVERRMRIIQPYTKWIRSFSCIEGNEFVPQVAKEMGLKTLVGAWLGKESELNRQEIDGLIDLAKQGFVDIAAVGNEVMYRNDLSEDELLDFIHEVKEAIPGIPVGYVDAYYEFSARPRITEACDVLLANCYPFWEGCHIDYSLVYMKQMFQQALSAGGGKKVIITETGWPSQGGAFKASEASFKNFLKYFINAQQWSEEDDIEMFYFASFDESWKVGAEGDVGAYWGIWDKNEKLKV
jgi:glucan 1,3-beta-glucosidase